MNCTPTLDRRARVPIHRLAAALGLALAGTAHAAWDCPSLVAVSADSFVCDKPRPSDRTIVEPGDLLHIRNALTQRDVKLPNR